MIQEHIQGLLFEHDCVIIPDFGGLITHFEPARIHPVRHTFLPPSKRVAFNEKLKLNDGLLISTFAYHMHLTAEAAQQQVGDFVRQLQAELQANQRFELRGLGLFRLNAEQKIEFEYYATCNFLNDSFGLPELLTRPVLAADAAAGLRTLLKEQQAERAMSTAKPSLRRKLRRIYDTAAILAIGGLSCSALYFISLQTDYNLSSLNPISLFNQPEKKQTRLEEPVWDELPENPAFPEAAAPVASASTEKVAAIPLAVPPAAPVPAGETEKQPAALSREVKKAVAPAPARSPAAPSVAAKTASPEKSNTATIKAATGRYYIIAGGYSTLKNAKWGLKQFISQGAVGKVLLPTSKGALHRVSVNDFASKAEALQNLPALKQKFGNNIWILNY
jgi:cell division septation protein DedD